MLMPGRLETGGGGGIAGRKIEAADKLALAASDGRKMSMDRFCHIQHRNGGLTATVFGCSALLRLPHGWDLQYADSHPYSFAVATPCYALIAPRAECCEICLQQLGNPRAIRG